MNISVVIPFFNGKRFIERAIRSVMNQTVSPSEIICVDDGSTDGGGEIVAKKFPDVVLVRQGNSGEGPARNAGILASRMDWIAFLDADDAWSTDHLRLFSQSFKTYQSGLFFSGGTLPKRIPSSDFSDDPAVAAGEVDQLLRRARKSNAVAFSSVDYFAASAARQSAVNSSSAIVARQIFYDHGLWFGDQRLHVDLLEWCKIGRKFPLVRSSTPTVALTRHNSSLSEENRRRRARPNFFDCEAYKGLPHFAFVEQVLESGDTGHTSVENLELYRDGVVTRHWPTVLLYGHQTCAQRAVRELRRPMHPKAVMFRLAASVPKRLARLISRILLVLAKTAGLVLPVSPFSAKTE